MFDFIQTTMVEHHTISKEDVDLIIMSDDAHEIIERIDAGFIEHLNALKKEGLDHTPYYRKAMEFFSNKG